MKIKILFSLFLSILVLGMIAISAGTYNMAATEKHWVITEKVIEWVRVSSIAARAGDLEVPALGDPSVLIIGAGHYDAMCTDCHLSPDQQPTELALGLYPQAPVFHQRDPLVGEDKKNEQLKEYFWVIKNGLKMTAMPAWGLTHDDQTVWAMASFVQMLGGMGVKQYTELTTVDSKEDKHDHNHQHHGHHDD